MSKAIKDLFRAHAEKNDEADRALLDLIGHMVTTIHPGVTCIGALAPLDVFVYAHFDGRPLMPGDEIGNDEDGGIRIYDVSVPSICATLGPVENGRGAQTIRTQVLNGVTSGHVQKSQPTTPVRKVTVRHAILVHALLKISRYTAFGWPSLETLATATDAERAQASVWCDWQLQGEGLTLPEWSGQHHLERAQSKRTGFAADIIAAGLVDDIPVEHGSRPVQKSHDHSGRNYIEADYGDAD